VSNLNMAFVAGLLLLVMTAANAAPPVLVVDLDGVVHPVTVEILDRAISQASEQHAPLLLIRLNTPGGLMDAMRQSVQRITNSPVPVAVLVAPSGARAASAGFFLLEASDIAAMAPGTNTGAAHPVMLGGEMDQVMKEKVENDAAAMIRSITSKRGRNAELAEQAVRKSQSFTEKEALDKKLIDLVANDVPGLLAQCDGRTITRFDGRQQKLELSGGTRQYEPNLRQRIMSRLADPNIALILLVLGTLGIYMEFSTPGLILPGVAGGILALLGLSALAVLPLNWTGVALILLALGLFAAEAFVTSHGVLGVGGAVAMILGAILLVDSPLPELRIRWVVAVGLALPFALITVFLASLAVKAYHSKVVTGPTGMINLPGVALTPLEPKGKILVRGEYWEARATEPVVSGEAVRVTGVDGLTLLVKPDKGA
jgi:membrane-bound serine protease (ClpP class)